MSDNNGWPDPARPGVPLNPDQEGWHWLEYIGPGSGKIIVTPNMHKWTGSYWVSQGGGGGTLPGYYEKNYRYLGPCLTPAEVDARVAQARRDALEEAAREAEHSEYGEDIAIGIRRLKGEGDD